MVGIMSGKNDFYPKIEKDLISAGYCYFDGDRDIPGKSRQHRRKPDYIAVKGDVIVIGEIKSPNEPPTSGSWRQEQPNDSIEFAGVREDVRTRETTGRLDPEVGGQEIIIRGQIPDYVANLGITYDLPVEISGRMIKGGYSVPSEQAGNVKIAIKNCKINNFQTINNSGYSATFIFDL